jgi:hypothetical protein
MSHEGGESRGGAYGGDGASTYAGDDDRDFQEETVDEMKIQTMYKMVDDVTINVDGQSVQKKILYLTNKQAALFDENAMARCIQALDIGDPKFVIKLCTSCGVASQMLKAHEEGIGKPVTTYKGSIYQSSEIDKHDATTVDTQVLLFMRTCILPLAKQTRAVILIAGANDCALSAALASVAIAEQVCKISLETAALPRYGRSNCCDKITENLGSSRKRVSVHSAGDGIRIRGSQSRCPH